MLSRYLNTIYVPEYCYKSVQQSFVKVLLLPCHIDVFHRFCQKTTPKVYKLLKIIFHFKDAFSVTA